MGLSHFLASLADEALMTVWTIVLEQLTQGHPKGRLLIEMVFIPQSLNRTVDGEIGVSAVNQSRRGPGRGRGPASALP